VFGLAGIGFETLVQGGERPTLLVLFGAMVGLPAFLRSDESLKLGKGKVDTKNDAPTAKDP
jgi:hypothetical protein